MLPLDSGLREYVGFLSLISFLDGSDFHWCDVNDLHVLSWEIGRGSCFRRGDVSPPPPPPAAV